MDNFLTWSYVSTFVGLIFTTSMIVEFIKEIKFIKNIPTKYLTCIIAFILILACDLALGSFKLVNVPLVILNSILITYTATGNHDFNKKLKNNEIINSRKKLKDKNIDINTKYNHS